MTRGDLKVLIRSNLYDAGVTFYSDNDLNDSIQDAYDDIAALTQFNIKTVTLNWQPYLSYYNIREQGVADFLNVLAIFNNSSNLWLRDDVSLRQFDSLRQDWENWTGQPQMWAPAGPQRVAIVPKVVGTVTEGAFEDFAFDNSSYYVDTMTATGTYKLYYSAQAPVLESDASIFLIATDMFVLLENYVTADMLEQAQEYAKSESPWWEDYYKDIVIYSERVKLLAKRDILFRI